MRRALLLTALATLLAAAPAGAQRPIGEQDLLSAAAFTVRSAPDATVVANVGDVDGDGRGDVAVVSGEEYEDDDELRIVLAGDRVPGLRSFRIRGAGFEDFAGPSAAGDVNGDGVGDIALSLRNGRSAVVFGRRDPRDVDLRRPEQRDLVFTDSGESVVTGAGDVNGDGIGDLIIPANSLPEDEGSEERERPQRGRATIVFGARGIGGTVSTERLGTRGLRLLAPRGEVLFATAPAGDVDGDGLGDLVLGSPLTATPDGEEPTNERELLQTFRGAAYIVYGRRGSGVIDLASPTAGVTRISTRNVGYLGIAVAGPGDVNGDGLPDVAVGAPIVDGAAPRTGAAFVVFGDRSRPTTIDLDALGSRGFAIRGTREHAAAGFALAPAGDVDGDGRRDVLVGAPEVADDLDLDEQGAGAVHLVYGSASADPVRLDSGSDRALTLRGTSLDSIGRSIAADVDLDADGHTELLASRPGACVIGRLEEGDVLGVEPTAPPAARPAGVGTAGPDRLSGGPVGDALSGAGGDDDLTGRDGHDCISGGDDADRIRGGLSGDALFGDLGGDAIFGDSGCDRIFGGDGSDVIVAGPASVPLAAALRAPIGARDRDEVEAGDGDDQVTSGADRDDLEGGDGDDRLSSGSANDDVSGDAGHDRIDGGAGRDFVEGRGGRDVVRGGAGDDAVSGDDLYSQDDDSLVFGPPPGADRRPGADRLFGGPGRDRIRGGDGADLLSGGPGNDQLDGDSHRDRILGGSGNDRILARGGGRDVIDCGPGRDTAIVDRRDRVRGCERVRRR